MISLITYMRMFHDGLTEQQQSHWSIMLKGPTCEGSQLGRTNAYGSGLSLHR
jgi:hypothetical protein